MPLFTTIAGGAAAAKASGVNFGSVKNFVGGILGGGKEPNAGQSDWIDALDNYEGISTRVANQVLPQVKRVIASGGSDREIGQIVTRAGGYSNVNDVMNSWKWDIIQGFIDQERAFNKSNQSRPALMGTGSAASGPGSFQKYILWGAAALVGIFLLTRA